MKDIYIKLRVANAVSPADIAGDVLNLLLEVTDHDVEAVTEIPEPPVDNDAAAKVVSLQQELKRLRADSENSDPRIMLNRTLSMLESRAQQFMIEEGQRCTVHFNTLKTDADEMLEEVAQLIRDLKEA